MLNGVKPSVLARCPCGARDLLRKSAHTCEGGLPWPIRQASLRRMDQALGEPDDGRDRDHRGRAEWPLGTAERSSSGGWASCRRPKPRDRTNSSRPSRPISARARDARRRGTVCKRDSLGSKPAEVRDKAIAALREAAAIVDAKAPDEAAAFKDWLRQIAQKTAEASTEGGFLGFGGVQAQ